MLLHCDFVFRNSRTPCHPLLCMFWMLACPIFTKSPVQFYVGDGGLVSGIARGADSVETRVLRVCRFKTIRPNKLRLCSHRRSSAHFRGNFLSAAVIMQRQCRTRRRCGTNFAGRLSGRSFEVDFRSSYRSPLAARYCAVAQRRRIEADRVTMCPPCRLSQHQRRGPS